MKMKCHLLHTAKANWKSFIVPSIYYLFLRLLLSYSLARSMLIELFFPRAFFFNNGKDRNRPIFRLRWALYVLVFNTEQQALDLLINHPIAILPFYFQSIHISYYGTCYYLKMS